MMTLISDFGTKSVDLAVARGLLYQAAPETRLLDVTHLIGRGNLIQAAYVLETANRNFPDGTVHVVLIDFFNFRYPRVLVCRIGRNYFIGADNGLFTLTFGAEPEHVWGFPTTNGVAFSQNMKQVAMLAAYCTGLNGALPPDDWNDNVVEPLVRRGLFHPANSKTLVECAVLDVDNYENVVLDFQRHQFDSIIGNKPFKINMVGLESITTLSSSYADVAQGQPLCRFNSAGFLTLAVNRGKIASHLNLKGLTADELIYKRVRIQM